MRLCVIPARGGSKRIYKKNIKEFCGRPIIAWVIETAVTSECFDRVIVSTDDEEIANVAKEWGAEVPFCRPAKLADDFALTVDVIRHAIKVVAPDGSNIQGVCCLYPTAVFVTAEMLRSGWLKLVTTGASYVLPVTSYGHPVGRALRLVNDSAIEMIVPENYSVRSQDLELAFHDVGQFYWGKVLAWLGGCQILGPDSRALELPRHIAQDIDTQEDWDIAEALFSARMNKQVQEG